MNSNVKQGNTERIAIIANTNQKIRLIEWSFLNQSVLKDHEIIANGKTAQLLEGTLNKPVTALASRSLGGYRELAKLIEKGQVDVLIFLNYPGISEKRQKQITELLHVAVAQDIIIACSPATTDIVMDSLLRAKLVRDEEKNA